MNEIPESSQSSGLITKLVVLAMLIAIVGVGYVMFGDSISLEEVAKHESQLRSYQESYPLIVMLCAFVIYVVVTGFSLPGAAVLSLVFGWYFGLFRGVILVSFASTLGATFAFLLSRYLFQNAIQSRFGDRLATFNRKLEEEGALYLFTLRLIPAVPFFVINLVMGLTTIRTRTFWWVSQLGMLPGTIVYINVGASFPSLEKLAQDGASGILTWPLIVSFIVLGLFPIIVKKFMTYFNPPGKVSPKTT